jgi:hypothetical protein
VRWKNTGKKDNNTRKSGGHGGCGVEAFRTTCLKSHECSTRGQGYGAQPHPINWNWLATRNLLPGKALAHWSFFFFFFLFFFIYLFIFFNFFFFFFFFIFFFFFFFFLFLYVFLFFFFFFYFFFFYFFFFFVIPGLGADEPEWNRQSHGTVK